MIDDDLQARAAAYATGSLGPDEARSFEALLAGRADLQALVRELHEVSAVLATGAPDAAPPFGLRDRVLAAARAEVVPRPLALEPRRRFMPTAGLAWAAAIAGLLLAGVQTVRLGSRDADLERQVREFSSVSQRRDVLEERLSAILDGHTTMSVMRPTGAGGPAFGGQVFWRGDRQTWLVHVFDLPKLPAGSVYQLWYVTANARISAGVFEVDSTGHGIALLHVPDAARAASLAAISVEPGPDGSRQPTGPIVMAGTVRSE